MVQTSLEKFSEDLPLQGVYREESQSQFSMGLNILSDIAEIANENSKSKNSRSKNIANIFQNMAQNRARDQQDGENFYGSDDEGGGDGGQQKYGDLNDFRFTQIQRDGSEHKFLPEILKIEVDDIILRQKKLYGTQTFKITEQVSAKKVNKLRRSLKKELAVIKVKLDIKYSKVCDFLTELNTYLTPEYLLNNRASVKKIGKNLSELLEIAIMNPELKTQTVSIRLDLFEAMCKLESKLTNFKRKVSELKVIKTNIPELLSYILTSHGTKKMYETLVLYFSRDYKQSFLHNLLCFFTDQSLNEITEFRFQYQMFKHFFKDEITTLNYIGGLVRIKNVTKSKTEQIQSLANFKDDALRLHLLIQRFTLQEAMDKLSSTEESKNAFKEARKEYTSSLVKFSGQLRGSEQLQNLSSVPVSLQKFVHNYDEFNNKQFYSEEIIEILDLEDIIGSILDSNFTLNAHLVKMLEKVIEKKVQYCLQENISYTKRMITTLVSSIQKSKFGKELKNSQSLNRVLLQNKSVKSRNFEDTEVDNIFSHRTKFLMILIKFVTDIFKSFILLKDDITGLEKSILLVLIFLTNLIDSDKFKIAVYMQTFELYSLYMQLNCFKLSFETKDDVKSAIEGCFQIDFDDLLEFCSLDNFEMKSQEKVYSSDQNNEQIDSSDYLTIFDDTGLEIRVEGSKFVKKSLDQSGLKIDIDRLFEQIGLARLMNNLKKVLVSNIKSIVDSRNPVENTHVQNLTFFTQISSSLILLKNPFRGLITGLTTDLMSSMDSSDMFKTVIFQILGFQAKIFDFEINRKQSLNQRKIALKQTNSLISPI